MTASKTVGFAGLGAMGYGMASNLLKNGFNVIGFDPSAIARERFAAIGGSAVDELLDASSGQTIFLVMVATPGQVDSLVFSENGLLISLPKNAILCLFSTLPPNYVAELPARMAAKGRGDIRLLDCPVSGGVVGSLAGSLSIMIGGEISTFDEMKPYLQAVAAPERLFYCGGLGDASTIKMLNQLLAGSHIVVAAEVLSFARSLGLSTRQTYETIMLGIGASWIFGDRGKSMLSADWTPKSAVTIFTKDLGIVAESAQKVGFNAPITLAALREFQQRVDCGNGSDDDASVVCNYETAIGNQVCEAENQKPLPTPPNEASTAPATLSQFSITPTKDFGRICDSLNVDDKFTNQPGLFVIPVAETVAEAKLAGVPEGSVVAVTGLGSPSQAKTQLQKLSSDFPALNFTDCHIIPTQDLQGSQILFTAESHEFISAVSKVLPEGLIAVPVKGPISSASAMFLAIRLGVLIHAAAAAECCRLAQAKSVSTDLVYQLIAGAAGSSSMFNLYFPRMCKKEYDPAAILGFDTFENAMLDLVSIKNVAHDLGFPTKMLNATAQIFEGAYENLKEKEASIAAIVEFWK